MIFDTIGLILNYFYGKEFVGDLGPRNLRLQTNLWRDLSI